MRRFLPNNMTATSPHEPTLWLVLAAWALMLVLAHKSRYPCLLVRQVNQFEKLRKTPQRLHQDPCLLVRQVN